MLPHLLINFEIQRYHQNEPRFNGVDSRNKKPTVKDETYLLNMDEYDAIRLYWVVKNDQVTFFDSFLKIFQRKIKNSFVKKIL